ncbi:MAG: hypothetical protein O3A00_01180 [Planctomycetota bacterium]|nr:hypothetical protein [Planctomycetota bacterium]
MKEIDDFAKKTDAGVFKNISRSNVVTGLKARVAKPELIDQGTSSLCGPAALMFSVLRKDAKQYVKYVTSLYDTGQAALGDTFGIFVKPGEDCKKFTPSNDISAVDWIALASLRDSENDFLDYQSPKDQTAGITSPSILSVWLKQCGFADRKNETNVFFTKDKANLVEASDLHKKQHTVCLLCKGDTVKNIKGGVTTVPSHWVVMTRPVSFVGDNIALEVFTWGGKRSLNMPLSTFLSTYFGFVSGKR